MAKVNYKLGILGGMGPLATVKMYERIVNKTKAQFDQDHIEMVILNKCSIPDRTLALTQNGEDPLSYLNEGIEELIKMGCEYFAMPCNTAHAYAGRLQNLDKIKMINMIEETNKYFEKNQKKVVVFCTNGTREVNVYQGPNFRYPDMKYQNAIMQIVTDTKSGKDCLEDLLKKIIEVNQPVLLAWTEFSIYYDRLKELEEELVGIEVYDAMEILIDAIIDKCSK